MTLLVALPCPAAACNVPVFRYALERWAPQAYEVIVHYREPWDARDQAWLDSLKDYAKNAEGLANFTLRQVDVSPPSRDRQGAERPGTSRPGTEMALPWLVVRYPEDSPAAGPVFAGKFETATLRNLLDSPARRQIAKRLLQGESAVWVLLESGDKAKDDAAAEKLQQELHTLEKTLKLPELTESPKDNILLENGPALRIAFSVLRLTRNDPAETMFVRMLLNSEDDLAGRKEPMVFPIYGRGIALYAIVGKGLTAENLRAAAGYIVGPCSCEVRKLNHGTDLLFTEDWEGKLHGRLTASPELPPLTGLVHGQTPPTAEVLEGTESSRSTPNPRPNSLLAQNVTFVLAGGVGMLAVGSLLIWFLYRRAL